MAAFDLRLRLQLAADQDSTWIGRVFDRLERLGVAEDVTEPDETGAFVLWCSIPGETPQAALSDAFAAIREAARSEGTQHPERPTAVLEFLSVDISKTLAGAEAPLPA